MTPNTADLELKFKLIIDKLESEKETLVSQLKTAEAERMEALKAEMGEKQAELEVAAKDVSRLSAEVGGKLSAVVSDLLQEANDDAAAKDSSKIENVELQSRLDESGESSTLVSELQAERSRLNKEILAVQSLHDATINQIEAEKKIFIDETNALRMQVEEKTIALSTESAQIASLQTSSTLIKTPSQPRNNQGLQNDIKLKEKAVIELRENVNAFEQLTQDLNAEIEERTHSLSSVQHELTQVLEEKDRITAEHALLVEKLSTVKNSVMPKLQAEMDEGDRLREEVAALTLTISSLREERALLKTEMASLANNDAQLRDISSQTSHETIRLQTQLTAVLTELEATKIELDKVQRRLAALQHHMAETEEANTQEALRVEGVLVEERETWEELRGKRKMGAREELEGAINARERDQLSISNLQAVLEEFQAGELSFLYYGVVLYFSYANLKNNLKPRKERLSLRFESLRKQLQTASRMLEEFRERALKAEERLNELDVSAPNLSDLEAELQEKSVEVGRLRARVISLESYLAEAIRRAGSPDNVVDRRLISNLVVQFLSTARADTKRFEMLSVIASVLRLTDEDKVKIGLLRKVGANPPPTSPFTDLWISFLIRESSNAHLREEIDPTKTAPDSPAIKPISEEPEKPPAPVMDRKGSFFGWKKD
ncbi:hypothetical protein BC829DRAFT_400983 [Chytridium lagenaria]|nr:hypothetical protein BC829DRAFT_400983 [Chytridium lagenaria]